MLAVHQPASGFVLSEAAIEAHLQLALASGAEIHGHERVLGWEKRGGSYRVVTSRATYEAGALVVATGASAGKIARALRHPHQAGAPSGRMVPAHGGSRALRPPAPARLDPGFSLARTLLWASDPRDSGIQAFEVFLRRCRRTGRPGRRAAAPGGGGAARVSPALFPEGGRPRDDARGHLLRKHPRPRFRDRPPSGRGEPLARGRLQRPRLQVLQCDRRDHGGFGDHGALRLRLESIPRRSVFPLPPGCSW